jgi:hypothetical protein
VLLKRTGKGETVVEEEPEFRLAEAQTEIPEYYSNIIRTTVNIYGLAILFGRARPTSFREGAVVAEPVCLVNMSPAHAKSLFLMLRHQLREYEKNYGTIPVAPEMDQLYGKELYG